MSLKKLPPIEKIAEAYSVLVDDRIHVYDDHADVLSSSSDKKYCVLYSSSAYASNDAATYWQEYPGYPIIALWMKQGILPYDQDVAMHFKDVAWKVLNTKYKRKYDEVLKSLYAEMATDEVTKIQAEITLVYKQMKELSFIIKKNTKKAVILEKK